MPANYAGYALRISILTPLQGCMHPIFISSFNLNFNTHPFAGVYVQCATPNSKSTSILTPLQGCMFSQNPWTFYWFTSILTPLQGCMNSQTGCRGLQQLQYSPLCRGVCCGGKQATLFITSILTPLQGCMQMLKSCNGMYTSILTPLQGCMP